jgi:hypothetical protein
MRRQGGEVSDDRDLALSFGKYTLNTDRPALVYSSLGDATGLIGPPTSGALALDASQMRLRPDRIGVHLAYGMPVVIGIDFPGRPGGIGHTACAPGTLSGRGPERGAAPVASGRKAGLGFGRRP